MDFTKQDLVRLFLNDQTPSQDQLEQFAQDFLQGRFLLVGKITAAMINAKPAAPSITFSFPGIKPALLNVITFTTKTFQTFVSPTRDLNNIDIALTSPAFIVSQTLPMATLNQANDLIASINFGASLNTDQDAVVTFDFAAAGNNPQDFSQGEIGVYFGVKDFPTLK